MRPSTVFLAGGLLALGFGIGFLLVPGMVLPLYAVATDAPTVLMARFFGVALVHAGLVYFLLRDSAEANVVRVLALAGVLGSIAGVVVSLIAVMGGVVNSLGWSTVAIYAVLLLGYSSCLRARTA